MTRVNASQVRANVPAQKPATPAKAKQAASTAQTAAAGWGSGAAKAQGLKISAAKIDEGPATTERVSVPKGFKAEVKSFEMKAKDKVFGEDVSLEQSTQQLTVTNPAGKKVTIGGGPESFKQYTDDWKSEIAATKKEPKSEYFSGTQLSWDAQSSIGGAGTAGKMFSTIEGGSDYMGGAHPNSAAIFRTYDANTGKQVKLDDLFSQKQINDLVNDIAKKLPTMKTDDGMIDGGSFAMDSDKKFIRDTINENFTLSADKNGKVKIDIAWESGIHALGGQMAHFTVDAPNDPAFRAKIGLE